MTGVHVDGADRVVRALHSLADDLRDMTPANRAAGELLLSRAASRVPRQSGRLAASGRADADPVEVQVAYDEVYAGVIHNGWPARNITPQPWLAETLDDQTAAVVAVYVDYVEDSARGFTRGV